VSELLAELEPGLGPWCGVASPRGGRGPAQLEPTCDRASQPGFMVKVRAVDLTRVYSCPDCRQVLLIPDLAVPENVAEIAEKVLAHPARCSARAG
jgi:hypothetical protein